MHDRGADLGLDVVADDRQARLDEAVVPVVLAGDEHRQAVDKPDLRLERLLDVPLVRLLGAGCAFVNCVPVFIASNPAWQKRFSERGLPIIGDDIKSQVGATITHRVLTRLFMDRGVRLDRTYQLNFGGNTDFLNMLERERLESKKISKTNAVTSIIDHDLPASDVHVGT